MKPTPLMHHNYAPFGRRAVAFLLDNLVFSLFPLVFLAHSRNTRHDLIALSFWILIAATIFEGIKGWSFGRYVTRTRLVDMHTGRHIGVMRDIVRSQLHALELVFCPWSYFRPLWNSHKLTFGDSIMSTVVVYVPKEAEQQGWEPLPAREPAPTPQVSQAA